MPGLLGAASVQIDLQQARLFGKVITSGTLGKRVSATATPTPVPWANMYVYPIDDPTSLGQGGPSSRQTKATMWRIGETSAVRADDTLTIGDDVWLINHCVARMNADEDTKNFAIYDVTLSITP